MPGQSLTQIRALLDAAGLAPQHRFGQNFLIDLNLMRKLVNAAEITPADVILEIGPGTGSLTEMLLDSQARVLAVEIDRGLHSLLRDRFQHNPHFNLLHCDALESKGSVEPRVLAALSQLQPQPGGTRKLVANLPYQIATPLLIDLLLIPGLLSRLTCTIQKEVGERLVASAGANAYGPASVIVQTLAEIRLIATVPPTAFWPRPKIDSVMIDLSPKTQSNTSVEDARAFASFVQKCFGQRRKVLRRIVANAPPEIAKRVFQDAGVSPQQRPEQLSPPVWQGLHRSFCRWIPADSAGASTAPL